MAGMQWGVYETLEKSYTENFLGNFQIISKNYNEFDIKNSTFKIDSESVKVLLNQNNFFSFRTYADSVLLNERKSIIRLVGVDWEREKKLATYAKLASLKVTNFNNDFILLGKSLIRENQLEIGGTYDFFIEKKSGEIALESFNLIGHLKSSQKEIEDSLAYVDISYLNKLVDLQNEVHSITFFEKPNHSETEKILTAFIDSGEEVKLVDWSFFYPHIKELIEFDVVVGWFYYVVMIVVAGLSVYFFYNIQIQQRQKDISIFLMLGLSGRDIFVFTVLELCLIFFASILGGVFLGVLILLHYRHGFVIPNSELIAHQLGVVPQIVPKVFSWIHMAIPFSLLVVIFISFIPFFYNLKKINYEKITEKI